MDIVDIYSDDAISMGRRELNTKFMQTLEKDVYTELRALARERGVTAQEFLRAVVVPDWRRNCNGKERKATHR